jgi:hypothetical protein
MVPDDRDIRFVPIADIDEPSKALVPWLTVGAARCPHIKFVNVVADCAPLSVSAARNRDRRGPLESHFWMHVLSLHTRGLIDPFWVQSSGPDAPKVGAAHLRSNLIDLSNDFIHLGNEVTGMREALIDLPQQFGVCSLG